MDSTTVLDTLLLCELSYKNQNEVDSIWDNKTDTRYQNLFELCKTTPVFYEGAQTNDAEAYTVVYNNMLVIAFRGTESFRDVISDLNIDLVPLHLKNITRTPSVHKGFYDQFNSIKAKLTLDINKYMNDTTIKEPKIIVTGHSLGGALATIAACKYSYDYEFPIKCVTFGSPRVGNSLFVEYFNNKVDLSLRYVNDNDPIPLVPLPIRFRHVDVCQWLYEDAIKKEASPWRWCRFLRNICCCCCMGSLPWKDHNCEEYYDDLINIDSYIKPIQDRQQV